MHFWCGEIFNDHVIANLLQSTSVTNCENKSIFDAVVTKKVGGIFIRPLRIVCIFDINKLLRIFCNSLTSKVLRIIS